MSHFDDRRGSSLCDYVKDNVIKFIINKNKGFKNKRVE